MSKAENEKAFVTLLERWNNGILEFWKNGRMEYPKVRVAVALGFQFSTLPIFHLYKPKGQNSEH